MKYILLLALLSSCGYASRDNEMTGQVKKVIQQTPLLCFDRTDVDISLGVIRNGVGSMSHEDIYATVYDPKAIEILKAASESGALVKVKTNGARFRWCANKLEIISAEIIK